MNEKLWFVTGWFCYFFFQKLHSNFNGLPARKVVEPLLDQMKCRYKILQPPQLNHQPSPVCAEPETGLSTEEEWSLQHSSVFPGLSVCESWYFGSQHGSTRGVRLTTVIVPCRSRLPQPWDWTMKYSKMPGLREGGLWQCDVKCETIEHL